VVNWNRKPLLEACLSSLLYQRRAPDEIVVVDNGSCDGSVERIRELAQTAAVPIRLIVNDSNRGFCAANNQGISAAAGEFVALLNNDAEAGSDWLSALLDAFSGDPRVGMAASKIVVWEDPSVIDKAGHLIYPDGQNRGRGSGELDRGQYDRREEVLWPDGCAAMYRRTMLTEIGGFDEDFFAYADDAELGLRARIAGWGCLYIPTAVVRHHRGSTLGQLAPARLRLIERNRVLLAAKLFPWSLLWKNGFYYGARLASGLRAALRGKGEIGRVPSGAGKLRAALAVLGGDLEALALLPRMLAKRRGVNRIRRLPPAEVKRLILSNRIPLRQLSEQAAIPQGTEP
jgi:GT2 family glycosyltransferase